MGWIHDPVANRTLWAEKGGGAWIEEREPSSGAASRPVRVHVALPSSDGFAALTAGLYNREMAGLEGKFARVVRLGSAAHDYWSLTDGRVDVLCFRRLKPWDHAAGLLIHEEAGGYNRLLSGEAYSSAARHQAGILCAPNQKIWQAILAAHTLHGNS